LDVAKDRFIQDFGERVRELRLERGLTQEKLADLAGMHFTAIGHIERASRSSTLETVLKLAKALQVQPRELIPDAKLTSRKPRRR
jgi:transcriptional regulator with XRE-family HTH domain